MGNAPIARNPTASVVAARATGLVFLLFTPIYGCSASGSSGSGSNGTTSVIFGSGGQGGIFTNTGDGSGTVTAACTSACTDFPAAAIIDATGPSSVPGNAATLFGSADNFDSASGPCVAEPQLSAGSTPGALFPANWLRPRFRFTPANGENLFEIRLQSPTEANDLVAYTTNTTWAIPADVWTKMGQNAVDQPITVTVRAVNSGSPQKPAGTRGTITAAPVLAGGTMIYWAASSSDVAPDTSKLVGFRVGDESVIDALTIPEVQESDLVDESGQNLKSGYGVPNGHAQCIGCHVSTPDGNAVGFTDQWPWDDVLATVTSDALGAVPPYVSAGAQRLINQPWLGMQTASKSHWTSGDRILVTSYAARSPGGNPPVGYASSYDANHGSLAWFDLETTTSIPWQQGQGQAMNTAIQSAFGTAWGFFDLDGETRVPLTPNLSHDGTTLVYTSATASQDGRIGDDSETDIHLAPYGDRMGGTVTPLAGASTPGVAEYYPSFSADDRLIAFNRVGTSSATSGKIYYRPDAEVYVVPATGGTATRLAANDPPACTGETSPGIINSWAKWSPSVSTANGKDYYFLIFSSARKYPGTFHLPSNQYSPSDTRASQLYMAAIVRDSSGALTTYPAVYLWNQGPTTTNLTPAWDEVNIPQVPPPE
jgi:hypothetical protein